MITVVIPTSSQAMLLERAARLRSIADVMVSDLALVRPSEWTQIHVDARNRMYRFLDEARAFDEAAEQAT